MISLCRLASRLVTMSTTITPMPRDRYVAHFAANALRVSGRSLLPGLTSSIAPTSTAPVDVERTWTSISSGNTVGRTRAVAGGVHAGAAAVAVPPEDRPAAPDLAPS